MITLELARRLSSAGQAWNPAPGDRFVVPDRGMDDDVFLVSEMVVEVQHLSTGSVLRFNGTTEWALDSIEQSAVVWLPREEQLRELLGDTFVSLASTPGGCIVDVEINGMSERHIDVDAERAYARALVSVLETTR